MITTQMISCFLHEGANFQIVFNRISAQAWNLHHWYLNNVNMRNMPKNEDIKNTVKMMKIVEFSNHAEISAGLEFSTFWKHMHEAFKRLTSIQYHMSQNKKGHVCFQKQLKLQRGFDMHVSICITKRIILIYQCW